MKIKASNFKSELCNHYDYEDCMNCSECGLCLETLNDEDVCPNCAQGNTIAYCLSGRSKGEVIDVTETESEAWDDGFKNGTEKTPYKNAWLKEKMLADELKDKLIECGEGAFVIYAIEQVNQTMKEMEK